MEIKQIYISHSSKVDYTKEIYEPLSNSAFLKQFKLILPHSEEYIKVDTKEIIFNSDLFIAEVSLPGTGIGLELGRAESKNIKILCLIKEGIPCNSSVKRNFQVITYKDTNDMVEKITDYIKKLANN